MKKIRSFNKQYLFILLWIGLGSSLNSQAMNILEQFVKLNEHYTSLKAFSLDFEVTYLNLRGKQLYAQKGTVVNAPNLHYVENQGRITLIHNEDYISVSPDQRLISYNTVAPNFFENRRIDFDITAQMDSLWKHQQGLSFKVLSNDNDRSRILIEDSQNENYSSYSVLINNKQNSLEELSYFLKKEPSSNEDVYHIRISYRNENTRPKLKDSKLQLSHYLKKVKGTFVPTEKFEGFQVINPIQTTNDHE